MTCAVLSAQANDNCAGATSLTVDDPLICGEAVASAGAQGGECLTSWAGGGNATLWYSFTASNDSIVLNFIQTAGSGCFIRVYGPGATCLPSCASAIFSEQQTGDPGEHHLLTGLTVGGNYLIQVDAFEPNGPSTNGLTFCINVNNPDPAGTSSNALLLDECGTSFSNTTNGGFWQNGTGTGWNNLDGNASTTCGGCAAGADTPFIINNVSWSTFCALSAGTWEITVDGIGSCTLPAPNQGVQASVFTGTTSALVNEGNSPNPISPGGSWTSSTLTVNAGECAYLMIDGFAGDACDYSVTLTNIAGGCDLLPVELISFNVFRTNENAYLNWKVASEIDNQYFLIERSFDGENYEIIAQVESIGDHGFEHDYYFTDERAKLTDTYYRLSEVDSDGEVKILSVKFLRGNFYNERVYMSLFPNPAHQSISVEFVHNGGNSGALIEIYSSTGIKVYSGEFETHPGLNNLEVVLDDLDAGNYLLRLISENGVETGKFIKKDN